MTVLARFRDVLVLCAVLGPSAGVTAPLFRPAALPKAAPSPPALLAAPVAVTLDRETLAALAVGSRLEADLPDGTRVAMTVERAERHPNGDISWMARVHDSLRSDFVATGTTSASGGSFASIEVPGRTWAIAPADGNDWLFDRTATEASLPPPPEEKDWVWVPDPNPPTARPKVVCPQVAAKPTPQATIDVLAIMGPDFIALHGGDAAAVTRINAIFNEVNTRYSESNVAVTFRVAGVMRLPWGPATANDNSAVLGAMANQTAPFTQLKAVRNFYGADQVAFFRGPFSSSSFGGVAFLPGDGNGQLRSIDGDGLMFTVIGDRVGASAHTAAHEFGHLMGNKHDRYSHGSDPSTGANSYSFGHYFCSPGPCAGPVNSILDTGKGFGTAMSYWNPVVSKFSSPSLTCQANTAGAVAAPCGVADLQDNVRSMNCIRQEIAALRNEWSFSCADLSADADKDGIPDCLEAGSGRVNGTKDNDIFASPLLFVAQQYRDFLGREADADGLNAWTGVIASAQQTRAQMAETFFNSAEFQGTIAPVARLYFAYFLRIPDYGGLNFWIGQFRAGNSLEAISNAFAVSPEFASRYGSLTNAQFVSLVYQNVLGRAPDAPGLAYWTGQVNAGMTRGQMMVAFSESPEYRATIGSEVYVTMMYMGMLRREPDTTGFNFWTGYMDAGNSGLALVSGFVTSTEYRARFLP